MVWLNTADELYENRDYQNALIHYKKVLDDTLALAYSVLPYETQLTNRALSKKKKEKDSKMVTLEDYANHQIAMCYKNTFDYQRAEEQFSKTFQTEGYPNDAYFYGNALKNNGKFKEAIEIYEVFIRSNPLSDSLVEGAKNQMRGCLFFLNDAAAKTEAKVKMADSIFNSGTASFAVAYFESKEKVMFSSARPGGVILESQQQSEYLCDIYWAEKDDNGDWKSAVNFGRPLNSAQQDAAATINNSNTIFYTRWSENRKNPKIYLARMMNGKFFEAYELDENINVEGYSSQQPFVSLDGKTLFFSSDRPGGEGGFDIWKIKLDEIGDFVGGPQNLGPNVNSSANEVTPFFHEATSTLFLSSDGYNTIGGYDAFKSECDPNTQVYSAPKNMGMPINSSFDDTYMIWDSKLETGFLSSDRASCEFGHCYNIYEIRNSDIIISLEGYAYNMETNEILPNTTITIKDVMGFADNYKVNTDNKGYYAMDIAIGEMIFMKAQKVDFFADAAVVNTESITESTRLQQDFYLDPIPSGEIEIKGIEYDFDAATLREESKLELDKLVKFLNLNNNLMVEIRSHTDERGRDTYNLKLSDRRAKSVVDYLIDNGIETSRLNAIGLGETEPVIILIDGKEVELTPEFIYSNTDDEVQETYHQRNRRTAFKVLAQ
jgi:outer membrane protein OmpA-like peptidoglycan-associated protein